MLVLRLIEERCHRDADDDRPIPEGRTPPGLLRPGEIELRPCPYHGSRAGQPMNVSALKQTGERWDEIADALGFLREVYGEARASGELDAMDLWRVSQLGSALPWFFILARPAGRAPAYAAALSKATLGTGILAQRIFAEVLAGRPVPRLSATSLMAGAEWMGTLVGDSEACAAPDRMILNFLEVLLAPEPRFAGVGAVAALAGSRASFRMFGAHYVGLKYVLWMSYLARRFLYADLVVGLAAGELRTQAEALLDSPSEPADCFVVGPSDPAATSLEYRAAWFASLAEHQLSLAPDGADAALCSAAQAIAATVGQPPDRADETAARVEQAGIQVDDLRRVARAIDTYLALDTILGDVIDAVEAGFCRAFGVTPAGPGPADATTRDRVLAAPPRRLFASLAPAS